MWEILPSRQGWNSRNKTNKVPHKVVSSVTIVALLTPQTLLIKLICILPKWNTYNAKICHFDSCSYAAKAKPFSQKVSSQVGGFI